MPLSEQPSSIHSSAAARHMTSMFAHGLKTFSKESQQKKTLTSYYLVTGRYYQVIAGNTRYYQLIAATNGYYLLVATNCYRYVVLGRILTVKQCYNMHFLGCLRAHCVIQADHGRKDKKLLIGKHFLPFPHQDIHEHR